MPYTYEEPELVIPLVPKGAAGDGSSEAEFTRVDGRLARMKQRVLDWKKARPRAFIAAVLTSVAAVSAASGYTVGAKPWAHSKARPALMAAKPAAKAKPTPGVAARNLQARAPAAAPVVSRPAAAKPEALPTKGKGVLAMAPAGTHLQPAALKLSPQANMPRSNVATHLVANAKLNTAAKAPARVSNAAAPKSAGKAQPMAHAKAGLAAKPSVKPKVAANAGHKTAVQGKGAAKPSAKSGKPALAQGKKPAHG